MMLSGFRSLWRSEEVRPDGADHEHLAELMGRPQRHRLLHGYPLAGAMLPRTATSPTRDVTFSLHAGRGLLVGVLPHPFCNPRLTGCGFCTFPHEEYDAGRAADVVGHVVREIEGRL